MTRLILILFLLAAGLTVESGPLGACPASFADVVNNACRVNIVAGGGTGGTASTFGSAFPSSGTAIGFKDSTGTNMAAGNLDASGNIKINMNACSGCAATGAAVPATGSYTAGNGSGTLTGFTVCDKWKPISITAATNIITGIAAKKTYICSIQIGPIPTATNVALVEGTTTTTPCDTGTAGMAGGTTAATGWNFAANGGTNIGTGIGVVAATATAADHVCLLVSAANQISGVISYTQY